MNYAAASHGNKLRLWDVADNVTGDICAGLSNSNKSKPPKRR
jgi:hypothetical protein